MRVAYFDCFAGISGDMTLGALIDAGADVETLREGLASLNLPPWRLEVGQTERHGLGATDVEVIVGERPAGGAPTIQPPGAPDEAHGHDHGHRHGHHHQHKHGDVEDEHEHDEEHSHGHGATRGLAEIRGLIRGSTLPERVREQGEAIFTRLAEAEARVHRVSVETVHFHEVGAVDSIVDVLGSVYALHVLGVEQVVASHLPVGHGFIRAAHGLLPVPAPATAELLKGVPLRSVDVEGELVTPTGAALVTSLASRFGSMPNLRLEAVGYGAGKKRFPFPNLLRVLIGERLEEAFEATEVTLLEANLDDMSPQLYEHVLERLFQAGALDVYLQPVLMKKGRPAQVLSVLCDPVRAVPLTEIVLRETTTLGVRSSLATRRCLERELRRVATPYGEVRVKIGWLGDQAVTVAPEYEDCRALALAHGIPLKEVQAAALAAARDGENRPPERSSA
jgi:uncharacterized protein (TIGR00299 family) protein